MPWPCSFEDILSGIDIPVSDIAAERTHVSTNRQTFLDHLATLVTLLRGEARVDSYDLVTSSCSLVFQDLEKRAPTSIQDRLC